MLINMVQYRQSYIFTRTKIGILALKRKVRLSPTYCKIIDESNRCMSSGSHFLVRLCFGSNMNCGKGNE
jgi:hypothetical protein